MLLTWLRITPSYRGLQGLCCLCPPSILSKFCYSSLMHQRHSSSSEGRSPFQDLALLKQGQGTNSPDFQQVQTLARILQNAKCFSTGCVVHFVILQAGHTGERFLCNLLIDVYGRYGALQDTLYMFHCLQRKNVFTWNIVLSALVQREQGLLACQLFSQMLIEGLRPDKFTYSCIVDACSLVDTCFEGTVTHCMLIHDACEFHVVVATSLINMYSKYGNIQYARHVFDHVHQHDTVSWSSMIEAYAKHGQEKLSVHFFQQMQRESIKADPVGLIAVLGACATFSMVAWGEVFHSSTIESGFEADLLVGNALINMYSKCGNLDNGFYVFKHMQSRDVISWTAIISAYNQAGLVEGALELFLEMQAYGVRPNDITYVNILSACSHEGMLTEGIFYFLLLHDDSCVLPTYQHYCCLIDLLGRAGQLKKGELLIMMTEVHDNVMVWQTLLGACKVHNDPERVIRVAERLIQLDPQVCAAYVTLSEFYQEGAYNNVAI